MACSLFVGLTYWRMKKAEDTRAPALDCEGFIGAEKSANRIEEGRRRECWWRKPVRPREKADMLQVGSI